MTARIWDAAAGMPLGEPLRHDDNVDSARFSPDGTRVITVCSDSTARIWDATTGAPVGTPLRHDAPIFSAGFSPDGARVVTASGDWTTRIWDSATGTPVGVPLRHEGWVKSVNFSPDGSRVITGSDDKTTRIWDAATGMPLGAPLRQEGPVSSAVFSPDGARVVTVSGETAHLWEPPSATVPEQFMKHAPDIAHWAQAVAGVRFAATGEIEVIPDESRRKMLKAGLPQGPWAALATWLRTRGPNRLISPNSKVTVRQVAERERDFGSRKSLESALFYDPTIPLARMLLANMSENDELAKDEEKREAAVPARAAHWRRYDLDRLPQDEATLWKRAAKILRQMPDAKVGVGSKPITAAEAAVEADRRAAEIQAKK